MARGAVGTRCIRACRLLDSLQVSRVFEGFYTSFRRTPVSLRTLKVYPRTMIYVSDHRVSSLHAAAVDHENVVDSTDEDFFKTGAIDGGSIKPSAMVIVEGRLAMRY